MSISKFGINNLKLSTYIILSAYSAWSYIDCANPVIEWKRDMTGLNHQTFAA